MTRSWFKKELHGRIIDMNALLMDAQIKFTKEECAKGMGQNINDATMKDVQINLTKEEYA